MGSAVFRVRDGQQIVTQYNPIVKNPNTEGQQTQRAKFKLMSQLAAVMAPGFGTMAVTKRPARGKPSQRNAFTQINMPLVEVSSDDQTMVAKIAMEQLKLTSSFRPLGRITLTPGGAGVMDVDIDQIPTDVTIVRVLLVKYPTYGDVSQAQLAEIVDVPVEDGVINHSFLGLGATGDKATVLAYGLIPSESVKASISLDNIHTPADDDFISAVELNAMVMSGEMAETNTIGANFTTGA